MADRDGPGRLGKERSVLTAVYALTTCPSLVTGKEERQVGRSIETRVVYVQDDLKFFSVAEQLGRVLGVQVFLILSLLLFFLSVRDNASGLLRPRQLQSSCRVGLLLRQTASGT